MCVTSVCIAGVCVCATCVCVCVCVTFECCPAWLISKIGPTPLEVSLGQQPRQVFVVAATAVVVVIV